MGRMLLSHNFDVSPDTVPLLSREEFAAVFRAKLSTEMNLQCQLIQHPHWIVDIRFSTDKVSPSQVGELCASALADKRRSQQPGKAIPTILILGGLKTTPPTSSSPEALQPGEWGVDVVETQSQEDFLQKIAWEATIAQRPVDNVFKIEISDH